MQRQLLSLYDLLINVRRAIALNFDQPIWITAEIAQRSSSNGHAYLTLVEKESDSSSLRAQINAVIWKTNLRPIRRKIQQSIGDVLAIGTEIAALVEVSYHQVYGIKLSIIDIDEQHTLGLLAKQRLETISKLREADLLDRNAKIAAPLVWQRIAVISSSNAAGYKDFIQSLHHNSLGFNYELTLFEARVQGDRVRETVIEAFGHINSDPAQFDLVVIIRGGGSKLDLRGFDDFEVCAAIAHCPIPVLTGIGHETDQSVADLVSSFNVKTPTAAATLIIERSLDFHNQIDHLMQTVDHLAQKIIDTELSDSQRVMSGILQNSLRLTEGANTTLAHLEARIVIALKNLLSKEDEQLRMMMHQAQLLDPLTTLSRGYTITQKIGGLPIGNPEELQQGDQLETRWASKTVTSTVS